MSTDDKLTGDFQMCGRCYAAGVPLFETRCAEKPEDRKGAIGMYHCPDCGAMLLAGVPHFPVCERCRDRRHPEFDGDAA